MKASIDRSELCIDVVGTTLVCLWQRMLFWPEQRTLFVADVHLGKAASFRASGIALPTGHSVHDLDRIAALLVGLRATRLVILGDLVHARTSYTDALDRSFRTFRSLYHSVDMILVRGNHDLHAGHAPLAWCLKVVSEPYALGPFACSHAPGTADGTGYELAGHLHPAMRVQTALDGITLPCFWQHAKGIVLPAFGSLTGNHALRLQPLERAVVIAGRQLHQIKYRE